MISAPQSSVIPPLLPSNSLAQPPPEQETARFPVMLHFLSPQPSPRMSGYSYPFRTERPCYDLSQIYVRYGIEGIMECYESVSAALVNNQREFSEKQLEGKCLDLQNHEVICRFKNELRKCFTALDCSEVSFQKSLSAMDDSLQEEKQTLKRIFLDNARLRKEVHDLTRLNQQLQANANIRASIDLSEAASETLSDIFILDQRTYSIHRPPQTHSNQYKLSSSPSADGLLMKESRQSRVGSWSPEKDWTEMVNRTRKIALETTNLLIKHIKQLFRIFMLTIESLQNSEERLRKLRGVADSYSKYSLLQERKTYIYQQYMVLVPNFAATILSFARKLSSAR